MIKSKVRSQRWIKMFQDDAYKSSMWQCCECQQVVDSRLVVQRWRKLSNHKPFDVLMMRFVVDPLAVVESARMQTNHRWEDAQGRQPAKHVAACVRSVLQAARPSSPSSTSFDPAAAAAAAASSSVITRMWRWHWAESESRQDQPWCGEDVGRYGEATAGDLGEETEDLGEETEEREGRQVESVGRRRRHQRAASWQGRDGQRR